MTIEVYQIFVVIFIYVAYNVCMEIKWYKEDREGERLRDMIERGEERRRKTDNLYYKEG